MTFRCIIALKKEKKEITKGVGKSDNHNRQQKPSVQHQYKNVDVYLISISLQYYQPFLWRPEKILESNCSCALAQ